AAAVLWLTAWGLHSRNTDGVAAIAYFVLALVETAKLGSTRLLRAAVVVVVLVAVSWGANRSWQIASTGNVVQLRAGLWRNAVAMIRHHPWVGVGIGNYTTALRQEYVRAPT